MAAPRRKIDVPCPQCGKCRPIDFYNRKAAATRMCEECQHGPARPKTATVVCRICGQSREVSWRKKTRAEKHRCHSCASREYKGPRTVRPTITHGESQTRLYHIWEAMKARCGLIKGATKRMLMYYRDRGIGVCEEWSGSYEAFRDWALANGYADHLTIDRIDGDMGYSPGNCRWATWLEQNRNRSTSLVMTVGGVTKPLAEWSRESGISYGVIQTRMKAGWEPMDVISRQVRKRRARA